MKLEFVSNLTRELYEQFLTEVIAEFSSPVTKCRILMKNTSYDGIRLFIVADMGASYELYELTEG